MYDIAIRMQALALVAEGWSQNAVATQLGISRAAIRDWLRDPERALTRALTGPGDCPLCLCTDIRDRAAYAYLLGQYLGDGCVSALRKGVYSLRVACADVWPGVMDEVEASMRAVAPAHKTYRVRSQGCTYVMAMWKHWPCLFPQHGPGRKHERPIELAPWQQEIVERHPCEFLRGLFHSDGCRITNWTEKTIGGERKRYEYGRYFFTNVSADIMGLCASTLTTLGVPWRMTNPHNLSVARREGVAVLDTFIAPKH